MSMSMEEIRGLIYQMSPKEAREMLRLINSEKAQMEADAEEFWRIARTGLEARISTLREIRDWANEKLKEMGD
jgi:hypothetical protein